MVAGSPRKRSPNLWLVSNPGSPSPASGPRQMRTSLLGDANLIAALRRGEATAATAFHDRVRPQVDRTLTRLLGRRDVDHEDLAQLAMIELIYTIDGYRGECSLETWTATLTAHVVYKHLRRRQTERRLFAGMVEADDFRAVSHHGTGREAMGRSAVSRIAQHLETLDSKRASTLVLHDVLGYDLQEVARITGVTVSAAQTRLVRGRRELQEKIDADPDLANTLEEMEASL
jgi:RNA polymerase sigma-70 factor (ECF subfamily)